jgi:hypothetical protein
MEAVANVRELAPLPVPPAISRHYIAGMSEQMRFVPPSVEFDPRLANELARHPVTRPVASDAAHPVEGRRDPFNGYLRMLTPQGGVLILYKDQYRSLPLTTLRVAAWIAATWIGGWLIFCESSLSVPQCLLAFALLMFVNALIARWRIEVSHSVEIRPDAMIVDGEDVFYAQDIGDNWPELKMKDDDPDRMVICAISGTRFIELMTANRLEKNDRTPEILAADLQAAIEQLWGRREVTFATALDDSRS